MARCCGGSRVFTAEFNATLGFRIVRHELATYRGVGIDECRANCVREPACASFDWRALASQFGASPNCVLQARAAWAWAAEGLVWRCRRGPPVSLLLAPHATRHTPHAPRACGPVPCAAHRGPLPRPAAPCRALPRPAAPQNVTRADVPAEDFAASAKWNHFTRLSGGVPRAACCVRTHSAGAGGRYM